MKKYTIIVIITVGIILGFLTGLYLYKINQIDYNNKEIVAETIEGNKISVELKNEKLTNIIQTNGTEEKTTPNCVITLKVYYEACEHLIERRKNIEEAEVNLTEEERNQAISEVQNGKKIAESVPEFLSKLLTILNISGIR